MTTLLEQLSQSNPDITAEEAAEFRACVLTIAQHNETDPKCIGFSLQDWEQWLENGGYGLNNFVAMLKQVCNAALGDAAVATLWDYAQSIATAPEGIPRLIEYVQTTYPGLEQRMTTLEALALEEEQRIQDTAGGMSKKGGIVTGVVSGAVAGAIIGVVGKHLYNKYQIKAQREAAHLKEETDRKAEEAYREETSKLRDNIAKNLNSGDVRDVNRMSKRLTERAKTFDFPAYCKAKFASDAERSNVATFKRMHEESIAERGWELESSGRVRESIAMEEYELDGWTVQHSKTIVKRPEFDKYVLDEYVVCNTEALLRMSDKDFATLLEGEGQDFVRGDGGFSQFVDDGKGDLERKVEDYFKNELVNVEKAVVDDVEIDIGKSVAQAANKLEVKAGRKAKKAVVRKTDRVEATVERWEEALDSDMT